ncbi:MAG: hypothetical protein ISS70_02040 [Phycisphaerae bacterium]|nr:hypothetical protein [Phycisphaerae bacterium]
MKSRIQNVLFGCLLAALMFVVGCTNAGPFVTNIAYDGEGNLLVTKNTVKFDAFFGTIHNGDNEQTIVVKTGTARRTAQSSQGLPPNSKSNR